jgi:hypothetical protein
MHAPRERKQAGSGDARIAQAVTAAATQNSNGYPDRRRQISTDA